MKQFLTIAALAQLLGVSERTVRRRVKQIPEAATLNDGRTKRYCVEDYIEQVNRRARA